MFRSILEFSTSHTRDTKVPQNYWQHARVAIGNSAKITYHGVTGIFHGFFPEVKRFQFSTSTAILKSAKFLMFSGRHDKEIKAIFGDDQLNLIISQRDLSS